MTGAAAKARQGQYDVVIVGSGFAGLCMGVRLKQAGIDNFVILERDAAFGGTWRANHYPGCAVDIPSHLYSFSFAQNAQWTRRYARREELLAYTRQVARDFDLERHIITGAALHSARYVEQDHGWRLETAAGAMNARCVVAATGSLNRPAIPPLPGLDSFAGTAFHSARWNHAADLRGKRVAVIGTGASAVQFIPEIVGQVARLDLYQRSAPWVLPRPDRAISALEQRLLARSPLLQRFYRLLVYLHHESRAAWYVHAPWMLKAAQSMARRHLHAQVRDPALRARLTPNYALGCKRVLLMNTYYPALAQAHVNVITDPIAQVRTHSIVSGGRVRDVDVIIFGTGFDVEQAATPAQVQGRGGTLLSEGGKQAYKGCTVAGFPNFFLIAGPNTGLGHNSMIYMIESGAHYVLQALLHMRARGLQSVEVKEAAQRRYNQQLQQRLKGTVWSSGCRSWYLDKEGRNFTLWPGFTFTYRRLTRRFDADNYDVT
ncbi:NAD(P)/FAD-dependent oxidoreductase [Massilia sp. PAMC28688]|uniref:flavin-containing monooxygenase n=1 Tax=Massilia sp. PAMC28688 TaxID=2861283 RepID=UPI001C62C36F|nr:NAD(P)/FAD-dependent oxidoreductase [Massilia sp. PAMC28688]QYF92450.1 NAD(P)/FAD-dependent oxidoreductase [Massilia sp. PAMC28688]